MTGESGQRTIDAAISLYAFSCGFFQAKLGFFLDGAEQPGLVRAPVPAYLIRHPDGLALFDTGLGLRYRKPIDVRLAPGQSGFEFDASQDIAAHLRAIDVDPGAIKWIVNSHFHVDHCGGNASIPNATIVVQKREVAAARGRSGDGLYFPEDYDTGHPVLAIDGEHDLYGDGSVTLFPTHGHTAGHQSMRIKLPKGDVILAADCCYLKRSLDDLHLPSLTHDAEETLRTLRRLSDMRAAGKRIFYGHDGAFWKAVPQGKPIA